MTAIAIIITGYGVSHHGIERRLTTNNVRCVDGIRLTVIDIELINLPDISERMLKFSVLIVIDSHHLVC